MMTAAACAVTQTAAAAGTAGAAGAASAAVTAALMPFPPHAVKVGLRKARINAFNFCAVASMSGLDNHMKRLLHIFKQRLHIEQLLLKLMRLANDSHLTPWVVPGNDDISSSISNRD